MRINIPSGTKLQVGDLIDYGSGRGTIVAVNPTGDIVVNPWYGETERHRQAALLGWEHRRDRLNKRRVEYFRPIVKQKILKGEIVPPEWLAEYPDLLAEIEAEKAKRAAYEKEQAKKEQARDIRLAHQIEARNKIFEAAKQKAKEWLADGEEAYIWPQMEVTVNGKKHTFVTGDVMRAIGARTTSKGVNHYRLPPNAKDKLPWEMTQKEYAATLKGQRIKRTIPGYYNRTGEIYANHRQLVEDAIRAGYAPPMRVLADYADLEAKRKYANPWWGEPERHRKYRSKNPIWSRLLHR